jgi:ethanolamine ammonia-lyase small subunit
MEKKMITLETRSLMEPDCWQALRQFTDARIALGRTGCSELTDVHLRFSMAHAKARDSIQMPFDRERVANQLHRMGVETLNVESAASTRATFITRPDLGRRLSEASRERLRQLDTPSADVLIVIGDGLSSKAVHKQAVPLVSQLMPYLQELGLSTGPIVLASQCRVGLGDDIAEQMHAGLVAMLIGERPGLSSPDSLSVYMTYKPYVGRLESERNCISNIRPEGLAHDRAAFKLAWLIETAYDRRVSGTALKDESDDPSHYRRIAPHYMSSLTGG